MSGQSRAELLNLRCYIEGVQVPIISATVTISVESPATAYIQLVATDESIQFRARSIVELYTLQNGPKRRLQDVKAIPLFSYGAGFSGSITRGLKDVSQFTSSNIQNSVGQFFSFEKIDNEVAEVESNYELLFLGELTGYSFYEDSHTRTINLLCIDLSNHLDTINQYTFDANDAIGMGGFSRVTLLSGFNDSAVTRAINTGNTTNLADRQGNFASTDVDLDIFGATGDGVGKTKELDLSIIAGGVLGLDQRLARILGQKGLKEGLKFIFTSVANSYTFYRDVDEELNLRDVFFIAEDPDTRSIYQQAQLVEYAFGYQNRYGTLNSVRNLIKIIFKLTHFQFSPLTTCPFYISDSSKKEVGLKQSLLKPELFFAEPPACNIILPDETYTINVSRHFLSEPTRGVDSTDHSAASDRFGQAIGQVTKRYTISPVAIIDKNAKNISYAPSAVVDLVNQTAKSVTSFGKILLPDEVFKGIIPATTYTSHLLRSAYLSKLGEGQVTDGFAARDKILGQEEFGSGEYLFDQGEKKFFVLEAQYKFLVSRFQNRTASVSTKYLPRLVAGFPAFVASKNPEKTLTEKSDFFGYVGYVIQITHFISQAGGVSSLTMSHVRPTNEYLDFFVLKNGSISATTINPDYRDIGVLPWTSLYKKSNIGKKYSEWLGGLNWKGENVERPAVRNILKNDNLGIRPMTEAMALLPGVLSAETKIFASSPSDHYLPIIREFMKHYVENVKHGADPTVSGNVEKQYHQLFERPVATRLQVRGYLNAYYSLSKLIDTTSTIDKSIWSLRQMALLKYGLAEGVDGIDLGKSGVDGIPGGVGSASHTRKSIIAFKKHWIEKLKKSGPISDSEIPFFLGADGEPDDTWDEAMDKILLQSIRASTAMSTQDKKDISDMYLSASSPMSHRALRRSIRYNRVLEYIESLKKPGGGLLG